MSMPTSLTHGLFHSFVCTVGHILLIFDPVISKIVPPIAIQLGCWGAEKLWGFPDSSVGKEYACNAGGSGSIPGSGRSAGEGIGSQLQYSWASFVAQLVKNPAAMWETWV